MSRMTSMRATRLVLAAALLLASAAALTPEAARADAQQQQNFTVWKQAQDCARRAFKQYPDYTPEGKAKREAARQECLRQRHLPVTPGPSPSQ